MTTLSRPGAANGRFRHGLSRTRAYKAWHTMIRRCYEPTYNSFERYGGRGIGVCYRWQSFENFYADMGEPAPGLSMERNEVDCNYEPGNCRWATSKEQSRNKRSTRWETLDGMTRSLADWADVYGVSYMRLKSRLRLGWDLKSALDGKKAK